jgi:asparagine synthase (glutamine-hydrolysing)
MCGIAGFYSPEVSLSDINSDNVIKDMCDVIINRGPDAEGYWSDASERIYLGHRRLSILDLSPAGHQPMISASGRYVMVFNGEIYNHLDLRIKLQSISDSILWRGHSDTETLLAGFEILGIKKTIQYCVGMFAFAVWDIERKTLILGRDRIGEKPLYYGWLPSGEHLFASKKSVFVFGSSLKSLRQFPKFNSNIDRYALGLYFKFNYVPAPYTIYQGIYKLEPGTLAEISNSSSEIKISQYWSLSDTILAAKQAPFNGSYLDAVNRLDQMLSEAVKNQMISDVPLGAFLSGGVDSSTIVALMQKQSSIPVKTFSIGFSEEGFNEAVHAKAVASHLGTDHTEMYVTASDAFGVIQHLPNIYDEPFSDSSQIPTFLVSQLARRSVTVSLSGDAGDELFCGYNRYSFTNRIWTKLKYCPTSIRKAIGAAALQISPSRYDDLFRGFSSRFGYSNVGDKIHKGASILGAESLEEIYFDLISHWKPSDDVIIGDSKPSAFAKDHSCLLNMLGDVEKMMFLDTITYLPDDILVKVDRAAMAVSLETRVPLLDHRVIEFAWSIPQQFKSGEGRSKRILRDVLHQYVPSQLIDRPKMGFGIPLGDWLRGPLRPWVESLLSEDRIRRDNLLNATVIQNKWKEHLSGKRNWAYHIWDVVMFQSWYDSSR